MFKKVIILVFVFLPFWYSMFIGYPIDSDQEYRLQVKQSLPGVSVSRRCFGVSFFDEFISCYKNHNRLSGVAFVNSVFNKTDQISPSVTFLLCTAFIIFALLSIAVLLK